MKLSALLLTFVIALGLTAPLEARTKYKAPKAQRHSATGKAPKVKKHPAKLKPMKYRKAKASRNVKPARTRKAKLHHSM